MEQGAFDLHEWNEMGLGIKRMIILIDLLVVIGRNAQERNDYYSTI